MTKVGIITLRLNEEMEKVLEQVVKAKSEVDSPLL